MNKLVENLTGLDTLTDQMISMDMLMSAKTGIKMYAMAASESATPEVKATVRRHLDENIALHEQYTQYAIKRGFYHPYNVQEQIKLDRQNVQTALSIPS